MCYGKDIMLHMRKGHWLHDTQPIAIHEIGGKEIIFREKYATCSECGREVTVPGLDDDNTRELESVYSGLKGCGLLWEIAETANFAKEKQEICLARTSRVNTSGILWK